MRCHLRGGSIYVVSGNLASQYYSQAIFLRLNELSVCQLKPTESNEFFDLKITLKPVKPINQHYYSFKIFPQF